MQIHIRAVYLEHGVSKVILITANASDYYDNVQFDTSVCIKWTTNTDHVACGNQKTITELNDNFA